MTPSFWNEMGPAYKRLPAPLPFLPNVTTDMAGGAVAAGIVGVVGVHAVGMGVRFKRRRMIAAREKGAAIALEGAAAVAVAEAPVEPILEVAPPAPMPEPATPEPAMPEPAAPEPLASAPHSGLETAEREAAAEAGRDAEIPAQPEER